MITREKFESIKDWLVKYISEFNFDDELDKSAIEMKREHTFEVFKNMVGIIEKLNFSQNDMYIAEIIALLHDIGRFSQYAKYKTYADEHSENHACLSKIVIINNNILDGIAEEEKAIILKSIENHNKPSLEGLKLDDRTLLFSKLIRDADKIDSYRILIGVNESPNVTAKEIQMHNKFKSHENVVTDEIFNAIMNHEFVKYKDIKYVVEHQLERLSWPMRDINFKETLAVIEENKYIDRYYEFFQKSERSEIIYKEVKKYIKNKLEK